MKETGTVSGKDQAIKNDSEFPKKFCHILQVFVLAAVTVSMAARPRCSSTGLASASAAAVSVSASLGFNEDGR